MTVVDRTQSMVRAAVLVAWALGGFGCSGTIGDPQQHESLDVGEDGPDVGLVDLEPVEDADPLARANPLSESCALPLLSCLPGGAQALSCTAGGGLVDLAYADGLAVRLEERGASMAFGIYDQGALCVTGSYPVDDLVVIEPPPAQAPELHTWRFENESGELLLQVFDNWVLVRCPDGSFDRHDLVEVAPVLPPIAVPGGDLCASLETPECQEDLSCVGLEVCCLAAGMSRCLGSDLCPSIGAAAFFGECLGPMFECFGQASLGSACVTRADGATEMALPGGRSIEVVESGGVWTMVASARGEVCYTAELEGPRNEWTGARLSAGGGGGARALVRFEGDMAQVDCDGVVRQVWASAITRHVPAVPDVQSGACIVGCTSNVDCAEGSCCPGPDGAVDRCVPLARCYDPDDPLLTSCLATPFWCFGRDHTLAACSHAEWAHLAFTEATYQGGEEATFFSSMGSPSATASASPGVGCFRASWPAADQVSLTDVFERTYAISLDGAVATVECPDGSIESFDAASVLEYLPVEPDPLGCSEAERFEICDSDAACGADMICCDQGAFTDCLPSYVLSCAQPARTCTDVADCVDGEACCERSDVRVCDIGLCGAARCCDVAAVTVCRESGVCP